MEIVTLGELREFLESGWKWSSYYKKVSDNPIIYEMEFGGPERCSGSEEVSCRGLMTLNISLDPEYMTLLAEHNIFPKFSL